MTFSGFKPSYAATGDGTRGSSRAAEWLCLAATPTFAFMALQAALQGHGSAVMLCPARGAMSAPGGMVAMYMLMCVFHAAPWLARIRRCGSGAHALRPQAAAGAVGEANATPAALTRSDR